MRFIIPLLLLLASISYGLDSVTVGDVTYEQIKLKKEYPSSLFIEHSGGTAFIQKSKLTEEQISSITSGKSPSNDAAEARPKQEIAEDGYIYERDSNNNITSIRIPDSVRKVECTRFANVPELTSVYLGKKMEKFGAQNFDDPKLVKFEVSPDNPHYTTEDGVILSKDKTVLVRVPTGKKGKYTTPKGIKRIASEGITHNRLSELVVGEGVEEIERHGIRIRHGWEHDALQGGLTNIVISPSVTKIHDGAFAGASDAFFQVSLPEKFQSEEELNRIGLDKDGFPSLEIVKLNSGNN